VHPSNVGVAVSKTLFHDFWLGFPMFIWLENTVKFCLETSYDQRLEFSSIRLQIKAGAIGDGHVHILDNMRMFAV
jgi:hypothetical protein